jgi:glycine cleavage system H protein
LNKKIVLLLIQDKPKKKFYQMNIPENLKYTSEHEWISVEGDVALVGITSFAQGELGDIVFVEIETEGETLAKGETFGTIEAVKTVSDLFMPVGGEVIEFNPALEASPELVNKDPYGQGWLIKIAISNQDELGDLLSASEYQAMLEA